MEKFFNVGEAIRAARKEAKLTQIDLAEQANIAINSLRRYENSERMPSVDILIRISTVLNLPLSRLLPPELTNLDHGTDEQDDINRHLNMRLGDYHLDKLYEIEHASEQVLMQGIEEFPENYFTDRIIDMLKYLTKYGKYVVYDYIGDIISKESSMSKKYSKPFDKSKPIK